MDDAAACLSRARRCLRDRDFDGAEPLLRQALEHDPKSALAYELLAKLLYRGARSEEAAAVCRAWLQAIPADPTAAHLAAATGGASAPGRASDAFVVRLFDRAAEDFDVVLSGLGYRVPKLIFESSLRAFQGAAAGIEVLDLGCGTGLCGDWIRPLARRLVGVDLSPAMLEQARRRGCYDELTCAELTSFVADCRTRFDLVMAADVFCYFGELVPAFTAVSHLLQDGGWFVFSVEDLSVNSSQDPCVCSNDLSRTTGFRLLEHGRYAHEPGYVRAALASSGLQAESVAAEILRSERGAPVHGLIFAARPASVSRWPPPPESTDR